MQRAFGPSNHSPLRDYERVRARGFLPRGYIDGLVLSNDSTDSTNDIAVSAGSCRSSSNIVDGAISTKTADQLDLEIPVSIIKQLDVSWAPENYDPEGFSGGDRSGGRSSSSLSNTTWHVFVIGGEGRQADILEHDATDPSAVLPGGYTAWRLIGSLVRTGGAIKAFVQHGDLFMWVTPVLDVSNNTPGTSANTGTLTVPTGVRVMAFMNVMMNVGQLYLSPLDITDQAATNGANPISTVDSGTGDGGSQAHVLTNTSAQIRYRAAQNVLVAIATLGFYHQRGKNS
jgi:hypothetical protein